jgi:glucose-1-phosphate thymidylyltransferase
MMVEARTAVVLARGLGTRMQRADRATALDAAQQAAAAAGVKAMMPLAGRPFLDYVLSGLADAGYQRAVLVVAPDHAALRDYYSARPPRRLDLGFAIQQTPRGTADALLAAESLVEPEGFVVVNGDNYYPRQALAALRTCPESCVVLYDPAALVTQGNIAADRIAAYALATVDGGYLASIEEKPSGGSGDGRPVSMNAWRFDARIFEACRRIAPSPRGELELPRAVDYAIHHLDLKMRATVVHLPVLDLSHRADIATVAERLRGVEPNP